MAPGNPALRKLLELRTTPGIELVKLGEVCPSDVAVALLWVDGRVVPCPMVWGFPKWDNKGCVFNARSESVLQKPMFRSAYQANPCAIPTNGFYEWKAVEGQRGKGKYLFNTPGDRTTFLAGVWSTFDDGGGQLREHFTILTTDANDTMRPYHDRMPVVLGREDLGGWLQNAGREEIRKRVPAPLTAIPAEIVQNPAE